VTLTATNRLAPCSPRRAFGSRRRRARLGAGRPRLNLLPVEMMVDANRDGEMSFDTASVHDKDQTTAEKPYRFWVNDDMDMEVKVTTGGGYGASATIVDGETIPPVMPDSARPNILTKRDLEDWTRLWIGMKGVAQMLQSNNGISVGLQFKPLVGDAWQTNEHQPSIKMCKAVEPDGDRGYLKDDGSSGGDDWADQQISGEYDVPVKDIGGQSIIGTAAFILPNSFWDGFDDTHPKHLIFEGVTEGKGRLVLVFYKGNQKIGEGGALYLELKNVRKMYERAKVSLDAPQIPDPWTNDHPAPLTAVPDPWNWPPEIDPDAEKKTIVFVHGWRMPYGEYLSWADTTYKRLWQLGYKGRFYAFRWPTYHGDNDGITLADYTDTPGGLTYNPSEYRAWLSGSALADFVNGLPNAGSRYLIAHSMGNIVAGSALRNNLQVTRYAMCNSAMAAMAYDDSIVFPAFAGFNTPDTDPHGGTRQKFGLANKLNPTGTTIVSFGVNADAALGMWDANNKFFKPQVFPNLEHYQYIPANPAGEKLQYASYSLLTPLRNVTSVAEAMGYITQSRSRAAGGTPEARGSISPPFVDLATFGFGTEHSAEWGFTIQKTYPFWNEILRRFDIDVSDQ
jgi:pimeloyl-ACP methyl ester carboxylesterase